MTESHPIHKLPKWAQRIIERQQKEITRWRLAFENSTRHADSRVEIDHYQETARFLDGDVRVRFWLNKLDDRFWIDAYLEQAHDRKWYLRLMGGDCIEIHPTSSNTVDVGVERSKA